jgi:hypothetical protein
MITQLIVSFLMAAFIISGFLYSIYLLRKSKKMHIQEEGYSIHFYGQENFFPFKKEPKKVKDLRFNYHFTFTSTFKQSA